MNKYVSFSCSDFNFLVKVTEVAEVFDATASAEDIHKVLVGNESEVYWRGTLSNRVNFYDLLDIDQVQESHQEQHCFVVCRNNIEKHQFIILQVDAIQNLLDIDDAEISPMKTNNHKLSEISDKIYQNKSMNKIQFVLNDVVRLIVGVNNHLPA